MRGVCGLWHNMDFCHILPCFLSWFSVSSCV